MCSRYLPARFQGYHLPASILQDNCLYLDHTSELFHLASWMSGMHSIWIWECNNLDSQEQQTLKLLFLVLWNNKEFPNFSHCHHNLLKNASMRFPWECSNLTDTSVYISKNLPRYAYSYGLLSHWGDKIYLHFVVEHLVMLLAHMRSWTAFAVMPTTGIMVATAALGPGSTTGN